MMGLCRSILRSHRPNITNTIETFTGKSKSPKNNIHDRVFNLHTEIKVASL